MLVTGERVSAIDRLGMMAQRPRSEPMRFLHDIDAEEGGECACVLVVIAFDEQEPYFAMLRAPGGEGVERFVRV